MKSGNPGRSSKIDPVSSSLPMEMFRFVRNLDCDFFCTLIGYVTRNYVQNTVHHHDLANETWTGHLNIIKPGEIITFLEHNRQRGLLETHVQSSHMPISYVGYVQPTICGLLCQKTLFISLYMLDQFSMI
jgi:hypothetical protein